MNEPSSRKTRVLLLALAVYFVAVQVRFFRSDASTNLDTLGDGTLFGFAFIAHAIGLTLSTCCVCMALMRRPRLLLPVIGVPGVLALLAVMVLYPLFFGLVEFVTKLEVDGGW
jgi:hypothetical protein